MKKINASWFGDTLLPALYKAKHKGVNIRSKSDLLTLAKAGNDKDVETWVCHASGDDIDDTADIIDSMKEADDPIFKKLGITEKELDESEKYIPTAQLVEVSAELRKRGRESIANRLCDYIETRAGRKSEELTKILWKSNLKAKPAEQATDQDAKKLAQDALNLLKKKTKESDDVLQEAVVQFLEEMYLSDIDFKGSIKPRAIFADLYYKNSGDDLDDLDINSEVTDTQMQLVNKKYIPIEGI